MPSSKEECKERYYYYKSHGICPQCGKEKAMKNHVYCVNCAEKQAVSQMVRREREKRNGLQKIIQ